MTEFKYAPMFQLGADPTEYYKIPGSEQYVSTADTQGVLDGDLNEFMKTFLMQQGSGNFTPVVDDDE